MTAADHVLHSEDLCRLLFGLLLFDAVFDSKWLTYRVTHAATGCVALACVCRHASDVARKMAVASITRHLMRQLPTGRLLLLVQADSGLSLESAMLHTRGISERTNRVVSCLRNAMAPLDCCPNQCCLERRVRRSSRSSVRVTALAPSLWHLWPVRSLRAGRDFWCLGDRTAPTARQVKLVRDNSVVATAELAPDCVQSEMHTSLSERACVLRLTVQVDQHRWDARRVLVFEHQRKLEVVPLSELRRNETQERIAEHQSTRFVQLRSRESELRVLTVWNAPHDCWKSSIISVNLETGETDEQTNPYYGDGVVEALAAASTHDALILVRTHTDLTLRATSLAVRLLRRAADGSGVVQTLPGCGSANTLTIARKDAWRVACFVGGIHFLVQQTQSTGSLCTATERGLVSQVCISYGVRPDTIPRILTFEASGDGSRLLFSSRHHGRHALVQLTNDPRSSIESSLRPRLMRCDPTVARVDFGSPGEIVVHRRTGGALVLSASQEPLAAPSRTMDLDAPDDYACPYR